MANFTKVQEKPAFLVVASKFTNVAFIEKTPDFHWLPMHAGSFLFCHLKCVYFNFPNDIKVRIKVYLK